MVDFNYTPLIVPQPKRRPTPVEPTHVSRPTSDLCVTCGRKYVIVVNSTDLLLLGVLALFIVFKK